MLLAVRFADTPVDAQVNGQKTDLEAQLAQYRDLVRHRLCIVCSTAFVAKTLPLPCVSTAFVAKTLPLPCVFHGLRG